MRGSQDREFEEFPLHERARSAMVDGYDHLRSAVHRIESGEFAENFGSPLVWVGIIALLAAFYVWGIPAINKMVAEANAAEQDRIAHTVYVKGYFKDTGLFSEFPLRAYREFKKTSVTGKQEGGFLGNGPGQLSTSTADLVDFDTEISGALMDKRNVPLDWIDRQVINDDQPETVQFKFTSNWLNQEVQGQWDKTRLDQYIRLWGNEQIPKTVAGIVIKIHRSRTDKLFQQ